VKPRPVLDPPPAPRRLWVFNLDAELELERGPGPHQTPQHLARALAPMLVHVRRLMAPGDACLDEVDGSGSTLAPARGATDETWLGATWCPTPSALRRLARAGAALPPSPSLAVLQQVNHRRFYLELGGGAPGARYVSDEAELRATLAQPNGAWLFKRPFGFAGRGQRRILGVPSPDDRRWLADSLRLGGFVAEPWLEVLGELGIHGVLEVSGRLALGHVCVQETNAYRAWVSTRRARPGDLTTEQAARLHERAHEVAAALFAAGYFGPFGVDAYLFKTRSGASELNPLSELNARFSMGYAVGMGVLDGLAISEASAGA
jgi:hypothetical protein